MDKVDLDSYPVDKVDFNVNGILYIFAERFFYVFFMSVDNFGIPNSKWPRTLFCVSKLSRYSHMVS